MTLRTPLRRRPVGLTLLVSMIASLAVVGPAPAAEAATTRHCDSRFRQLCTVITSGPTESDICYTNETLASHRVYSGSATITFTEANSFSFTASATFGLGNDVIAADLGMSVTNQWTSGFAVQVGPIYAGQTGSIHSRVNRTLYTAERYDRYGNFIDRTIGTAIEPIPGSFCTFIR